MQDSVFHPPPPCSIAKARSTAIQSAGCFWGQFCIALALLVFALKVQAAEISASDLSHLRAEARAAGAAAVMVHLLASTPADLVHRATELEQLAAAKERALLRELGDTAFRHGRWSNRAGQIGLHVSEEGLARLQASGQALRVMPGFGWRSRTPLLELDMAHDLIEDRLRADGTVQLDVVLNANGLVIHHQSTGQARLEASEQAIRAAVDAWVQLLASATEAEVHEHAAQVAQAKTSLYRADANALRRTVRVSRGGLLLLADSSAIRSIRPAGSIDSRPRSVDQELFRRLDQAATVEVVMSLRTELMGGRLSHESLQALTESNRRALDSVLAAAVYEGERVYMSRLGAVGLRLSRPQLERLTNLEDRRILALTVNHVVAEAQMSQVAQSINLPWAHTQGFRGAGQSLLVFDEGIQSSHPFLTGRVSLNACFSTEDESIGLAATCPMPHVDGTKNSEFNTPGSGEPIEDSWHGTHVAGIAAGSSQSMRGPAPESSIISVRVFSKSPSGARLVSWRSLLDAFHEAVLRLPPLTGVTKQPHTVNLSIGLYHFANPSACRTPPLPPLNAIPDMDAFIIAIQSLRLAGVPIVAAAGNGGRSSGVAWPACLPGVIKVASVLNYPGPPFARAATSNAVARSQFPGEIFWAAPGGGPGSGGAVFSSVPTNAYASNGGTSMASPHVAGLYAAAKGAMPSWDEHDVTAWFLLNASINVDLTFDADIPPVSHTWPMIVLNAGQ